MYGLEAKDWAYIVEQLIIPLKNYGARVWIFGSRAIGTHQKYSDIDFLYEFGGQVPPSLVGELKEKIIESSLPIKIDLVDKKYLAKSYLDNISEQMIELCPKSPSQD